MSNTKLKEIQSYLNNKFIEREGEVEALLVALLSRQHLLLIGPAGTGKSALSTELSKIIDGSNYFQWLLTRFSTPEELFGVLSLKDLEQGVYKRNVADKMPVANMAFLDEIFKANSAILNSLLTIINERIYFNNGTPLKVPLMSVVGASNEYPEEGEGLEALFDRFLLRFEVNYVEDNNNFISMLKNKGQATVAPTMKLSELEGLQFAVDMVQIPDEIYQNLSFIRQDLKDEGIVPSDRRFKQSLSILQAKAFLDGRNSVDIKDMLILKNSLWETADQKEKTLEIVYKYSIDELAEELKNIKDTAHEIMMNYNQGFSGLQDRANIEAETVHKMKILLDTCASLEASNPDRIVDIKNISSPIQATYDEVVAVGLDLVGV